MIMKANNNSHPRGKWAHRFVKMSLLNGVLAIVLTSYLLYLAVFGVPAASRIIAGGGAGTWLIVGYFGYITIGVLATIVFALLYRYLEVDLRRTFTKFSSGLTWLALVLWTVGVIGSMWLMMHAGYSGGAASLSTSVGGLGWTAGQIHTDIMQFYPSYIAGFMGIAVAGILLGLIGYAVTWLRPSKVESAVPSAVGRSGVNSR